MRNTKLKNLQPNVEHKKNPIFLGFKSTKVRVRNILSRKCDEKFGQKNM